MSHPDFDTAPDAGGAVHCRRSLSSSPFARSGASDQAIVTGAAVAVLREPLPSMTVTVTATVPGPVDCIIDCEVLAVALEQAAADYDAGWSVYAALVRETPGGLVFGEFEAGDGALADDLWAPSSVKVLAGDGALAQLANLGFTWAAVATRPTENETRRSCDAPA